MNSTLVSHVDLLPTMLDLGGLEIPPVMAGQSLVPHYTGKDAGHAGSLFERRSVVARTMNVT